MSLRRHRDPRTEFVLLSQLFERRLTDIDHDLDDLAREWKRRFVKIRDWRNGVAPDVEGLVDCEVTEHLLFETSLADFFLADAKRGGSAGAGLALFVHFYFGGEYLASWL